MNSKSILDTLKDWIVFNEEKDSNELLNHITPLVNKQTSKKEEKSEINSWVLSWMIKYKKFNYLYEVLNENFKRKKDYLPKEQLTDFKRLSYSIVKSGISEYYKEQKYFTVKELKKDYDFEDDSLLSKDLLIKYDQIYNPEKIMSVVSFSTPIGENSTFGDLYYNESVLEKEKDKFDYENEKDELLLLLNNLSIKLRVSFKLYFFYEMLNDEDYKFIQKESGLTKSKIIKKIKENFDATTKIQPLSEIFIAELLNTTDDVISARISRSRKKLEKLKKVENLKKDYNV